MLSVHRSLAKLFSLVVPWTQPTERAHGRPHTPESDAAVTGQISLQYRHLPPTLETLNLDVFRLIALELRHHYPALEQLALTSRTLRASTSPVLFARCHARCYSIFPPEVIRPYIRSVRYTITMKDHVHHQYFADLLQLLPSLTSLTLDGLATVSWQMMTACLSIPRITTLEFGSLADLNHGFRPPYDPLLGITSSPITKLIYNTPLWREFANTELSDPRGTNAQYRKMPKVYRRECAAFSVLLPRMNEHLRQLVIPLESAPVPLMATLSWPKLQELTIRGRYVDESHTELLPVLLAAIPQLRKLVVLAVPKFVKGGRAPILGRHTSPRDVLCGLRSLTVAYPDPDDAIFSVDTSHLVHLSIRDCPRYYTALVYIPEIAFTWPTPILSAAECLSVLSRMDMPLLASLELVYKADAAGDDDELLEYIVSTYPTLTHLELHRYRSDREEIVDFRHIASLLAASKSLRTVHLNLDFEGDHGAYNDRGTHRDAWLEQFRDEIGPKIVEILEACPALEYVGLLYHGIPWATWAEFHPSRNPEPRFVLSYDAAHKDSEPIPTQWTLFPCKREYGF